MLLNHEEIVAEKIFSHPATELLKFTDASVNLTMGEIILMDGVVVEDYEIPTRGIALVVSNEEFSMPNHIMGYTTVKNGLSRQGIMAVNVGIVDNNYKGPISTVLINFGKDPYPIKKDEVFLRMTFHKFSEPSKPAKAASSLKVYKRSEYIRERKLEARAYLNTTFLSLTALKEEIANKAYTKFWRMVGATVAIVGLVTFVLTYSIDFMNYRAEKKELNYKNIILKMDSLAREINRGKIESVKLNKQLDSLKKLSLPKIDEPRKKAKKD